MLRSVRKALFSFSSRSASAPRAAGLLALALTIGAALATPATQAQDQTFTVNSTADAGGDANTGDGTCANSNGNCTLRAAIEEANSDAARDKVDFSGIPTTNGFATISIGSRLQATEEINIDGTTAPGYPSSTANGPIVKINASNTGADGFELAENASGSQVVGLAVVSASGDGIDVGVTNATVRDCFVGLDVDGTTVQGNSFGIYVPPGNSDVTLNGNVVSGNDNQGLLLNGNSHTIINNIVGLDYNGDAAKGNDGVGIDVSGDDHLIGNAFFSFNPITGVFELTDNGNTVSANSGNGIVVTGDNNAVKANNVGTSSDGSTATGTGGTSLGNGNNGT